MQTGPELAKLAGLLRRDPADHAAHRRVWELLDSQQRLPRAIELFREALRRRCLDSPPAAPAMRRRIEQTLLCAVDCLHPELSVHALRRSMAQCEFDSVKLLTDADLQLPDIEVARIAPLRDRDAYSRFMVKELLRHLEWRKSGAERVLMVQWDGFVIDAASWDETFALFDYIGARWPGQVAADFPRYRVGNGGFSLRSRALLEALQDAAIPADHPEDATVCRRSRAYLEARHGIAFASDDIADRFSYEHCAVAGPTFGFHGIVNMSYHLPWPEFRTFEFLGDWLLRP